MSVKGITLHLQLDQRSNILSVSEYRKVADQLQTPRPPLVQVGCWSRLRLSVDSSDWQPELNKQWETSKRIGMLRRFLSPEYLSVQDHPGIYVLEFLSVSSYHGGAVLSEGPNRDRQCVVAEFLFPGLPDIPVDFVSSIAHRDTAHNLNCQCSKTTRIHRLVHKK